MEKIGKFSRAHYSEIANLLRQMAERYTDEEGNIHLSVVREHLATWFAVDNPNFNPQVFNDAVGPIRGVDEYEEDVDEFNASEDERLETSLGLQAKAWANNA